MKTICTGLFFVVLFASCYEKQEGCLDLQASNFDVAADRPCADCCTYPSLQLSPLHSVIPSDQPDTSFAFSYDSAYAVAPFNQDSFRFQSIFFYLYDFRLKGPEGTLEVSDEFSWYDATGEKHTGKDDYLLIDAGSSSRRTIGELHRAGTFDSLIFYIGLPEEIRQADITRMPSGHPLDFRSDSLNWEAGMGYIPLRVALYRDAAQVQDSTVLRIFEPVRISLSANGGAFEVVPGADAVLKLQLNYLAWLEGADLRNDTPEALEERIRQQLPASFSWE